MLKQFKQLCSGVGLNLMGMLDAAEMLSFGYGWISSGNPGQQPLLLSRKSTESWISDTVHIVYN